MKLLTQPMKRLRRLPAEVTLTHSTSGDSLENFGAFGAEMEVLASKFCLADLPCPANAVVLRVAARARVFVVKE